MRRGRWRIFAATYLALLAFSHLLRWLTPAAAPALPPGGHAVEVAGGGGTSRARLAWREWGERRAGTLPVVLLHGSPGSGADFLTLAPALATGRRVLAPDLPGFGASQRRVPDYSIRAHATYVCRWLDELGIAEAHFVGFSMGGGVGLEIYRQQPRRVASLTLLAAIGVQELELLGDYRLNHLVHGGQLGLLWLLREGVPHMGLLDRLPLDIPYARNFYDSDQRPLRGVLERFEPPMLILHGEDDPLVPAAAAREHHRLVPQSELRMMATDHFFLFRNGARAAPPMAGFFARVEAGEATRRGGASPARLAAAARPFDARRLPPLYGFALLLTLFLLALATLVSEVLTCVAAGLLVAAGRLPFVPAAAACFAGIYAGDLLLFAAGRLLGRPALERAPLRWWVSEEAVERSSAWFRRRGPLVIVLSRFLPGTRLPTYLAAGLLRTGFWRFAGVFLLAAAAWTPALVALAAALGTGAREHLESLRNRAWLAFLLVLGVLLLLRQVALPAFTHRGRRRLAGAWRRWTRWEFWPPWLFYPPVVLYILYLGLRHRGLTLFTCANPGIPAGGVIGESKAAILEALAGAGDVLPRWRLLPAGEDVEARLAAVEEFRHRHGLPFPLVLKPDAGQRGAGVAVVRDLGEARRYLEHHRGATLAQEYVPGEEFGVFYYRFPGEARGHIFAITEKLLPRLVGDGRRSLARMVLDDPRAAALADTYLADLEARGENPERVPAAGEEIVLVEVGTHCRGAIFLDATDRATPALEAAVDAVSRRFEGFHFGRYDLRLPTPGALAAGGPFKVIELNGVTSEATNIYDPRHSLFAAYRVLFAQWRLAFAIGAAHRAAGHRPTPVPELLRAVVAYRRGKRPAPVAPVNPRGAGRAG